MIWYALQVRGGREMDIARDLRGDGCDVFLPVETILRRARNSRGKITTRATIKPLIPSYLFSAAAWVEHKHVYGPLALNGDAYAIPDDQLTPLKLLSGREREDGEATPPLSIGQVVRLIDGNLAGLPITVVECTADRLMGDVSLFGKVHRIPIARDKVAAYCATRFAGGS
jgi:transcription antitermination factor NusG